MDLSIIILNYQQRGLVRQCLRGILVAEPRCRYEVVVVDNHSGDGCLQMCAEQFPWVTRIASPTNRGFGAGNNLGIRRSRGRSCLILNPDIVLFPGQLDQLVEFLDEHPRAGVVGPRLINPDGTVQASCRRFPGLFWPLWRRTWFGSLPFARRRLGRLLMEDFDHAQSRPVDWLMGACLLVRRAAFDELGGLDERFFLYLEDLDFCRRCWQAGWEVWYAASVSPMHYHTRSSAEGSMLTALLNPSARHHLASWVRYLVKYRGQPPAVAASAAGADHQRTAAPMS